MDPSKRRLVSDTILPSLINGVQSGLAAHVTADNVGLIWLSDQTQTAAAVSALNANQNAAGINEILARQGLLAGRWCLDPHEDLSPGQAAEIDRRSRDAGVASLERERRAHTMATRA